MYRLEGRCRDEDVEMAVQLEAEAKSCRLKLLLHLSGNGRVLDEVKRDNGGSAGSKCNVGCVIKAFELEGDV
jgi:hypothetical protein